MFSEATAAIIPLFKRQIAAGGPVTVTDPNIERFFMTIPEASRLVIQAGGMANGGEIFILDMGDPVKIVDLAKNLIKLSGLEVDKDIKIVYTGLREGEKMYEELLMNEENTIPTKLKGIMISMGKKLVTRPSSASLVSCATPLPRTTLRRSIRSPTPFLRTPLRITSLKNEQLLRRGNN